MMTNDHIYIQRAIDLAFKHSTNGEHGPFGAVVVQDDKIVGQGYNQVVTECDPTAHAEVNAIRSACSQLQTHVLDGCTIYCSCEPCPMCLAAIYWARIKRVVYACDSQDATAAGFDDSVIYKQLQLPWSDRKIKSLQLDQENGQRVFEQWLNNPNRKEY